MEKKHNIINTVRLIKKRQKMFFGEVTNIYYLYYHLSGYLAARAAVGISDDKDELYHTEFNTWVYRKYEAMLEHDSFWAETIDLVCKDPKEKAELFFNLFEEFFELKNVD
ncbi:MAG: hypothetical protein V4506_08970 [Bacteroidota bacterium]